MAVEAATSAEDGPAADWSRFLDVVPAILWTIDPEGRLTILNEAGAGRLGAPSRLDTRDAHLDFIHPDERVRFAGETRQARIEGRRLDIEVRTRIADGAYRWMRVRARRDPDSGAWHGATEDVHERREAELALRIANERLALALDGGDAWAWDLDVPSGRFWYSDRWQTALGYAADDIKQDATDLGTLVHPDDQQRVSRTLRAHLAGHVGAYESEYRVRRKDGSWAWVIDRGRVVDRDAAGKPLRAIGTRTDITARREAEAQVRENEAQLKTLLDNLGEGVIAFDTKTGRGYVNDALWRMAGGNGQPREGTLLDAYDAFELIDPATGEPLGFDERPIARILRGEAIVGEEVRARMRSTGHVIDVVYNGQPVLAPDGSVAMGVLTVRDVTERRAAEARLRASEARFRGVFESGVIGMIIFDAWTGEFLAINDKLLEMTGSTRARYECGEWDWRPMTPPEHLPLDEDAIEQARRYGWWEPYEKAYIRPDGTRIEVRLSSAPMPANPGQVAVCIEDITARKQAERALAASEERLRLATDGAGMGAWDYDLVAGVGMWSESACRLLGFPPSQRRWRIEEWQARVHPDDIDRVMENALKTRASGGSYVIDFRIVPADGSGLRWVQSSGSYLYDEAGNAVRHVGVFFDISARKAIEDDRREGRERLRAVIESLEEGVAAIAPDTNKGFANGAFHRLFAPASGFRSLGEAFSAYELQDADGRVLPEDERPIRRVLSGERIDHLPLRARFRDGREIDVVYRGEPILDDGGVKLAVVVVRDVTERNKARADLAALQQELIHVSRVSAMGAMAGSLAHELNQPLAAIANYAAAARLMLGGGPTQIEPARDALRHVADEAVRAGQIVHRLRRFITKGEVDRRPASLTSIVREALAIAHADASASGAQVKLKLDPDADAVVADRIQLQQVVFNLVRNAVEAMADQPDRELTIASRPSGEDVELLIADRGPGLPPQIAAHLFEPFVTTKDGGMGIGLPICQSIVRAHGGDIRAETRPRGGTVFILTLPRSEQMPAE